MPLWLNFSQISSDHGKQYFLSFADFYRYNDPYTCSKYWINKAITYISFKGTLSLDFRPIFLLKRFDLSPI